MVVEREWLIDKLRLPGICLPALEIEVKAK
jgi:hypothetical protein